MTATRLVSGVERLWLAADRIAPPFVNQLVLEGDGAGLDADRVSAVIDAVSARLPGSRMRLQGRLRRLAWVADGPTPRVRRVDGSGWTGAGPEGAPFLLDPLPPAVGPTTEVVIIDGEPARVAVRTHHAVMDGRGTLEFARAVFAALRGDEVPVVEAGPTTDRDLALAAGRSPEDAPPRDCPAPVRGASGGAAQGMTWRRVRLSSAPRRLLPRLAIAIADATGEPCRVDVPVDLRPARPGLASTANLCGLVRLPVSPGADPEQVATDLRGRLDRGEGADFVLASERVRGVPLSLMAHVGSTSANQGLALARFGTTATLSNLGRIDLTSLSCDRFTARRSFFIPPGNPGLPLFIALNGDPDGVELCATAPAALASHGRLDRLLERLVGGLA